MQERNLGRSGLRVSVVGLGCNNLNGRLDMEGSRKVVHKAIDLGVTLFDTADMYSCSPASSARRWTRAAASRAVRAATS